MNPRHLSLRNVGRFAELDLTIPEGCLALAGPNGSGKSTILNAIELALFADGARDLGGLVGPFGDQLELTLEFDHAGESYRVRRGAGKRTTLDLEQRWISESDYGHGLTMSTSHAEGWNPLTRETAKETQALIEATIGLSRRTFRASSFLRQGDAAAFPESSPADRKAILGEILDPRRLWPSLAERARVEGREAERETITLTARHDAVTANSEDAAIITDELERLSEREQATAAALGLDEADLDDATSALAASEADTARERVLSEAATSAAVEVDRLRRQVDAAAKAGEEIAGLRNDLAEAQIIANRIPELERKTEAARLAAEARTRVAEQERVANQTNAEFVRAAEAAAACQAKMEALNDETIEVAHCDRCLQVLGREARLAALESLRLEQTELARVSHEARSALEAAARLLTELRQRTYDAPVGVDFAAKLAESRAAEARLSGYRSEIATRETTERELPALRELLTSREHDLGTAREALQQLRAGLQDVGRLEARVAAARRAVADGRSALEAARTAIVLSEDRLRRARAAEAEAAEISEQLRLEQARLEVRKLAERACGRDGVPAMLVENVVPLIETEANRVLDLMPTADGATLRVALETQRTLKGDATAVRETLDISVSDPDGARPYESYSGGERARLNFALRIALARLLAGRRGAESRLLAVDELEYLDELGQEQLVGVVRSVAADFDRVLVVSHSSSLRDVFDDVLVVGKSGGVSRLVLDGAS